jgi:hypothetical protein
LCHYNNLTKTDVSLCTESEDDYYAIWIWNEDKLILTDQNVTVNGKQSLATDSLTLGLFLQITDLQLIRKKCFKLKLFKQTSFFVFF